MTRIPYSLRLAILKPVRFYPYPSIVIDEIYCIELNSEDKAVLEQFERFEEKCKDTYLNMGTEMEPQLFKNIFDNKVVIECVTSVGNKVYVGFYNNKWKMGLGVNPIDKQEPYNYSTEKS